MTTTSWYRRSVWNYKGNREYTKSGYELAKERFNANDLEVDCSDRHYVITGANSGIGLEIAREVAKRGGVLHMVCRNFESAKLTRSDIITNTGNDKIHIHTVDLSKPREVVSWAQKFAATHEKIHVLVNNAGCMVHERQIDDDGIETNFAVNTLAVHIITMTLLPVLQKNEDARVVTVSSAGMLVVRLDPMDLMHMEMEPFNGTLVYSQNKRQQVVMTLWYAQRYDKVHFSAMHPGWADTPAIRNSMPQFFEAMKGNLRTPSEGADTAVWLAISKAAVKFPSGFFFQDREPASTHLPLAWTKTSMEEENLLMQKLMVLMQNATSEVPEEETKPSGDNVSAVASHIVANGVKAPFASNDITSNGLQGDTTTLSAVSISKSEEAKLTGKGEDEVERQTEMKSPVPKEEILPKGESKLIADKETVEKEDDVTSPPDVQAREEELSPEMEGKDQVSQEGSISPQPSVQSQKVSEPEPSSVSIKEEPASSVSRAEIIEEPVPDSSAAETKEPEAVPTTEEKEEPVPETSEEKEELAPETESLVEKEVPSPEIERCEEKEEPAPETMSYEEKEPAPESMSYEEKEEPAPETMSHEEKEQLAPETMSYEEKEQLETEIYEDTEPVLRTPTSEEKELVADTPTTEMEEAGPHPTIPGFRGEPVIEELVSVETEPSQVPTEAQHYSHDENLLYQEDTSKTTENEDPATDHVSPTPSERTYQSAASVVEHLIDITAEKAAASMSS